MVMLMVLTVLVVSTDGMALNGSRFLVDYLTLVLVLMVLFGVLTLMMISTD
jgi:hypothetical protein